MCIVDSSVTCLMTVLRIIIASASGMRAIVRIKLCSVGGLGGKVNDLCMSRNRLCGWRGALLILKHLVFLLRSGGRQFFKHEIFDIMSSVGRS